MGCWALSQAPLGSVCSNWSLSTPRWSMFLLLGGNKNVDCLKVLEEQVEKRCHCAPDGDKPSMKRPTFIDCNCWYSSMLGWDRVVLSSIYWFGHLAVGHCIASHWFKQVCDSWRYRNPTRSVSQDNENPYSAQNCLFTLLLFRISVYLYFLFRILVCFARTLKLCC